MENENKHTIIPKPRYVMPRDFLNDLFNEEMDNIRNALAEVRVTDPKTYLRTIVKIGELVIPKTGNIRHDIVNHDLDELAALGRGRDINYITAENVDYIEDEEVPSLPPMAHPDITDSPDDIVSSLSND